MTRFAKILIGMSIHSWVELLDKNHFKCSMDKGTGLERSRIDKGSPESIFNKNRSCKFSKVQSN